MRAADVEKDLRSAPPHVFTLSPNAWTTDWEARPKEPVQVGLRRVAAATREQANKEALVRADRCVPEHRRHRADAEWRRCFEVAFLHYLLGYALCHPQDVRRDLWADQDGQLTLEERAAVQPGDSPLVSRRFTDEGLTRLYDELELAERRAGVGRRVANDGEMRRLGAVLADGSLLVSLREIDGDDARAAEAHLRILLGQALDLLERGREAPHPDG